jgi:hypothetical protein
VRTHTHEFGRFGNGAKGLWALAHGPAYWLIARSMRALRT